MPGSAEPFGPSFDGVAGVLGYYFATEAGSPNFTSFQIPNLANGSTYTLWAEGASQQVAGGEIVDLTSAFPGGVKRFYLLGMGDEAPEKFPHVFGATFAAEGVADFYVATAAIISSFLKGDMNNDGAVDNEDINGFVLALVDLAAYQASTGLTNGVSRGDINNDAALDNEDITPFVNVLLGGSPAAVPEPSSVVLAGLGLLAIVPAVRRRM